MDKVHCAAAGRETGGCADVNCGAVSDKDLSNNDLTQADCRADNTAEGAASDKTSPESRMEGGAVDDPPIDLPGGSTGQPVDVSQLQEELAAQKARAEEYYNRLIRLQADFDNYRKRTTREREEVFKYASASLCEALLPVLDNFELALAAREENPVQVAEGVAMIFRQLQDVLQKEGLSPVAAVGEQFDPTRHEAVMQEITDEYDDNTVIEEFRRGYFLKDKLLRPAMVKVAKSEG
ncbi:nucleotide exchange factor GrpE [Desulfallas thermosapovorans]|uniref:Protein GrpE n=1 Tax=Desulfallas thermosapovorans DSM 6562 TaxID=1121431 RepID=A0A5S4ZWC0_9FIRM|nr:nucleotide exchange factor GrpE [Desulfallas thermosapovorans]TYO97246.1 molecular chaperone GrpE [Desulfallas thermosapovorans DSM 6562]